MPHITQMELQTLRTTIAETQLKSRKMQTYSQQSTDPVLKEFFSEQARQAQNGAGTLMDFLQTPPQQ